MDAPCADGYRTRNPEVGGLFITGGAAVLPQVEAIPRGWISVRSRLLLCNKEKRGKEGIYESRRH